MGEDKAYLGWERTKGDMEGKKENKEYMFSLISKTQI